MRRIVTDYTVRSGRLTAPARLAVASDLHDAPFEDILPMLEGADALLVPGDLVFRFRHRWDRAIGFLREAAGLVPVYYSLGNHEWRLPCPPSYFEQVTETGAVLLDDRWVLFRDDLALGGISSRPEPPKDLPMLRDLERQDAFRLVLCHHPEWYTRVIAGHDIDLTVAGHAHGGQIVIGGHGLYASGQGLLPRYTAGWYEDGKLLVSRGLTNSARPVPRIGVPCELLMLHLLPEDRHD